MIPASMNNHHAYTSGLLHHSVEVAQCASNVIGVLCHTQEEKEHAIIAGLFHDIGKTKTYLYGDGLCYIPNNHEFYFSSLLKSALEILYVDNNLWYEVLLEAWKSERNGRSECVIAKAVRDADQLSAKSDCIGKVFDPLPTSYFYKYSGNTKYLRPIE